MMSDGSSIYKTILLPSKITFSQDYKIPIMMNCS